MNSRMNARFFCWSRQRDGCGAWLRWGREGAEGLGTCSGAVGSPCLDAPSDCDTLKWCCQVGGRTGVENSGLEK